MADLQKKIEILFQGTNRVGDVITSVGRDLDNLNYRITTVAQPFAEVTASVAKLDALLAALAAGGIAIAYSESSKLKSAFTELKKVAGDNAEALNTAKASAKDLSNEYGEAAASVLSSTASYKQAGFDIQGAMTLAKDGMDLVIAGELAASTSSEILIASLKGFKAPAEDARRLIDILNEVSNNYATDIEQLGRGMAGISPIALKMGFSMEETAGIITPVIEVFRSGDEAAVALKTGLLKLIDDSKPVQEALASIGVSQKDANGQLRSGKDILYDVAKAFQTIDEPQKLFVTQQLVGIEQSARMVEVFDGLSKSSEITAVAMNSTGSAAKEVAERLKDPEVAVNRLIQGLKNLASSVGDDFQEAGTGAVNGITAILNSLEDAVDEDAFEPLLGALNDFLDGISQKLLLIAENLPEALEDVDYSGFLDELGDLRETVGSLFDDIDISDPESLARAIQKVVDTFESLVEFSEGVASVFVTVAGYASDLIDGVNSLDDGTLSLLGNLSGLATTVTMVAAPVGLVTSAIGGFGSVLTTSTKLTGSMATGLGSLITSFPTLFSVVSAGVGGWAFGTLLREAIPEIDETGQSLLGLIDKYTGLFGVYEEQQKVQAESIAVEQRYREVMEARAQVAETAAEVSYEANLAIVNATENAADSTEDLTEKMRELGILVEEPKKVAIDTAEAGKKLQELEIWRESTGTWKTITVPVDTSQVEEAKEKIEEIPAVKRLEFETDLRIAEVKAQAETIQASLKFKAEVDVARIQADAEIMKAAFESVGESVAAIASTSSSMFSDLADFEGTMSEKWFLQDVLKEQMALEREAVETQKELTHAQAEYLKARTERMKSGEALITVDGAGLQPHLEMIMWELFAAIQIRAKEEGLDQLLLGG
ncbi:phage tail tape measure protein [uncultured Desulfosarcina sp.]|uniref:phage tail tape measure protein n=1 Tax=uncultured Desulfosarcina sp. TaxID=218289 RepID=UPI0029C8908F|nr:phage tail tape measure protein [uncultured Desulfosarcina sp.]